jgi:type I restriction enzyme R subunit
MMAFNENTRVKIPALLHLTRLGYEYVSLKSAPKNEDTNIFTEIFSESVRRLNADDSIDCARILDELKELLDYEDLGKAFYKRLTSSTGTKLLDFNDYSCRNDSFSWRW